ncbi:hypothetical protein NM688_g8948 [Phlebia brevispora]|uniref:Uncharacterized protein n=1 Tax=Phlebia brevispora TaxID=194682 RepID=A0ACC1RNV6_9APHY|nr:hypothetical protein NM688_g8948 [Phlebia brevispora]
MSQLHSTQVLGTRVSYAGSLVRRLDAVWNWAGEQFVTLSLGSSRLPKAAVLRALSGIVHGRLTVEAVNGDIHVFGDAQSLRSVTLRVRNDTFWRRLLFFNDLGFAESYMNGEIDCDDVSALLQLVIANKKALDANFGSLTANILGLGRKLTEYKFLGDPATSGANISAHYDLGNLMFQNMLSEDMCYSSAIFLDYTEDLEKTAELCETLEAAQMRKMKHLITRLNIQPGHRVLEIGAQPVRGWGTLAILIAGTVDCTVDTVTLSGEQRDLATARIAAAGLSDRITVHYMDFRRCRDNAEWASAFDRFVSVEMIENVGREFIEEYWAITDWAMKPCEAIGVVQVITMPEARIPTYDRSGADFVQKWASSILRIFPGGYIPSFCFLVETMNRGTAGRLTVDSVTNIGPHYARTLREWKRKFPPQLGRHDCACARREVCPRRSRARGVPTQVDLDYCEAGFATRSLGDHVITFTREGNVEFGCDFKAM